MKVIIDLPETTLDHLREIITRHGYQNTREFVSVAIENQIELEQGSGDHESLIDLETAIGTADSPYRNRSHLVRRADFNVIPTVPPPALERLDKGPLWGQYNRIFPIKIVLRVLANLLQQRVNQREDSLEEPDNAWVHLETVYETSASIAREVGRKLHTEDQLASRDRAGKLAVALPTGDDPEKSLNRFQSHFIGDVERDGDLTGAAPRLQFVDLRRDPSLRMGLTDAGRDFAQLWNPLLDGVSTADHSLSDDECTFYLSHVRANLPDEWNAMLTLLHAITNGENRPTDLDSRVGALDSTWSDAQASTIRSGLVGRMCELGLLHRERVGQRGIAYTLTDEGDQFVTTTDPSPDSE